MPVGNAVVVVVAGGPEQKSALILDVLLAVSLIDGYEPITVVHDNELPSG
jgi:hypothetical protein